MKCKYILAVFACVTVSLHALTPFSDNELKAWPTPARLAEVEHAAAADGWHGLVPPLHAAALRSYELGSTTAEAWLLVNRWAEVFGTTDSDFLARWTDTVKTSNLGYSFLADDLAKQAQNHALSDHASPALQAWLLAHTNFSSQFFSTVSPCDLLPKSFDILSELQARYPDKFPTYANLALAIALVYDVPPPTNWPHAQVSEKALPRKLPAPVDAFAFWMRADESGRTLQHLSQLSAVELKYVVDAVAPLPELEWAQKNITIPLSSFSQIYDMVRYRSDRIEQNSYTWPEDSYDLVTILKDGGICVDQAYFSCEVGKAKGVPTLLFAGAGKDGWHAWFGYLDGNRRWQLDAGRYPSQRLVIGYALDPQTWGVISDHELKFLSERFRLLPAWRWACMSADFAAIYLADGRPKEAARAARMALNYDQRHLNAWETLIAAQSKLGASPMDIETLLRQMKLAFQNYPDIEAVIVHRIADSMRARGEASAADFEERQSAQKIEPARSDLSLDHDVETMRNSMEHDPLELQVRTYYAVLKASGPTGGIEFFYSIVRPFALHLKQQGYPRDALQAAREAQGFMQIKPNSQLDDEMRELLDEMQN